MSGRKPPPRRRRRRPAKPWRPDDLPKPPKNVVRIDAVATRASGETHGWQARVHWKRRLYTRYFTDGVPGAPRASLRAAVKWQKETLERFGVPLTARMVRRVRPGQGVFRRRNGYANAWSVVYSPTPGTKKEERFSFAEYGSSARAKAAALERRREIEVELYGREIWPEGSR